MVKDKKGHKRKRQPSSDKTLQHRKMASNQENVGVQQGLTEASCLKSILDSLNLLHSKFDNQKTAHDKLENQVFGEKGVEPRLTETEAQCDDNTSDISQIKGQYATLKREHDLLVQLVIKQNAEIGVLKSKVEDLTGRSMKQNIVISGLKENTEDSLEQHVSKFLNDKLSVQPQIDVIHRLGEKREGATNPRPIVVRCASMKDKQRIMQNVKYLKDVKNDLGKPYFISDQLPEGASERRRRYGAMMKDNAQRPQLEQAKMKIHGGQLFVNNELYRSSISPPKAQDLFDISKEEESKMDKLKLVTGDIQSERGSTFYGVAVRVQSIHDVRRAYKKVSLMDPGATHTMAAYIMKTNSGKMVSDYADDDEHGGGLRVLDALKGSNVQGTACFVIRHYGGVHIGFRRFVHIKAAADSAIKKLVR